jgi:hypothetical protein
LKGMVMAVQRDKDHAKPRHPDFKR